MNNKYIDNKLREFRERFKGDENQITYFGWDDEVEYDEVEQFIKEALAMAYEQGWKDGELEGILMMKQARKLKSEQEECECFCHISRQVQERFGVLSRNYLMPCTHCQKPEEKRQEKVLCKDSEGNKCNEGIVDFQGNMVVVREGTLITLTHCFPQNGMFFGLKEAQFNKVRDYLIKMIGELLYTQASDDKEQTIDKKLTSSGKGEETEI